VGGPPTTTWGVRGRVCASVHPHRGWGGGGGVAMPGKGCACRAPRVRRTNNQICSKARCREDIVLQREVYGARRRRARRQRCKVRGFAGAGSAEGEGSAENGERCVRYAQRERQRGRQEAGKMREKERQAVCGGGGRVGGGVCRRRLAARHAALEARNRAHAHAQAHASAAAAARSRYRRVLRPTDMVYPSARFIEGRGNQPVPACPTSNPATCPQVGVCYRQVGAGGGSVGSSAAHFRRLPRRRVLQCSTMKWYCIHTKNNHRVCGGGAVCKVCGACVQRGRTSR